MGNRAAGIALLDLPAVCGTLGPAVVVRLRQRRFEKLERLAAREELPAAVAARRLLSERLDAIEDERASDNRGAVRAGER